MVSWIIIMCIAFKNAILYNALWIIILGDPQVARIPATLSAVVFSFFEYLVVERIWDR